MTKTWILCWIAFGLIAVGSGCAYDVGGASAPLTEGEAEAPEEPPLPADFNEKVVDAVLEELELRAREEAGL